MVTWRIVDDDVECLHVERNPTMACSGSHLYKFYRYRARTKRVKLFFFLEVSGAVNICRVIRDTMVPVESSSQIQILSSSDNRICEYLQLYM
jgi:hypothetical protein